MKGLQPCRKPQIPTKILPVFSCRCTPRCLKARSRHFNSIRAGTSSGSQEQASAPSQEPNLDPEDKLWEEIAREDNEAADLINGKAPVFDLFPQPPPRLTAEEQKQRAFKLSRRPLRQTQSISQAQTSRRRQAEAARASMLAEVPAVELMPADLRPTPPLPPICNLPRSSAADREAARKRMSSVSEHYKPLESGEGIGSYARKVAAAGLGPLPNPRLVVEYHPMVSKARMDRNVAAGYDPNAEWGSDSILRGEDPTDLGDDEDEEEEQDMQVERAASSSTPTDEADYGDIPSAAFEESDEVDWGADFVEDEEETLQDEFGRALDETIEQRLGEDPDAEEDTEGFGVWEEDFDEEDILGVPRRSKETGGSSEQANDLEGVDDLDSAIENWQKLSRMRGSEG